MLCTDATLTVRSFDSRRISEAQFAVLRDSADVAEIASAWRVAGGAFFKVQLRRSIVCDTSHAFSFKAVNHICEMVVIIICFGATVGVFVLLARSPQMEKERKEAGERMWTFLMVPDGVMDVRITSRKIPEVI